MTEHQIIQWILPICVAIVAGVIGFLIGIRVDTTAHRRYYGDRLRGIIRRNVGQPVEAIIKTARDGRIHISIGSRDPVDSATKCDFISTGHADFASPQDAVNRILEYHPNSTIILESKTGHRTTLREWAPIHIDGFDDRGFPKRTDPVAGLTDTDPVEGRE